MELYDQERFPPNLPQLRSKDDLPRHVGSYFEPLLMWLESPHFLSKQVPQALGDWACTDKAHQPLFSSESGSTAPNESIHAYFKGKM